jgi:predicted heme/steroid binding protein
LAELGQFDGSDHSLPILLAVRGKIYDVSEKEETYGPSIFFQLIFAKVE